jgi:hypothetical protein
LEANSWVTVLPYHGEVLLRGAWILIGGCERFRDGDPEDKLTKLLDVWYDKPRRVLSRDGVVLKEWIGGGG